MRKHYDSASPVHAFLVARVTRPTMLGMCVCVLLAAAGCRDVKTEDQRQVLTVAYHLGGSEGRQKHWDAWKARFEQDNPLWRLEMVPVAPGTARGSYIAAGNADALPDVMQLFDLTEWLAEEGYVQPLPAAFIPRGHTPGEKVYGAGGGVRLCGIAVNASLASAAGIQAPPENWTQFLGCLRKMQQYLAESGRGAKGCRALIWGSDWSVRLPMEMAVCADLYTRDAATPSWAALRGDNKASFAADKTAETIAGNLVELVREFVSEQKPPALTYEKQRELFFQGKAAFWFAGTWIGSDIAAFGGDVEVDFWPMPSMVGRTGTFVAAARDGGWGLARGLDGERQKTAVKALEALLSMDVYQAYLDAEGCIGQTFNASARIPSTAGRTGIFYENVRRRFAICGAAAGLHASQQTPPGFEGALERACHRMIEDALARRVTDIPAMLTRLDEAWDKGESQAEEGP
ncbi:MAG: extracellular solute-binding protein [Planctomycetaceae bacterium]|nr:extracellular solute-binding protein [Planctomycetaceae bacterium]